MVDVADPIKATTLGAIAALQEVDLLVVMLTGDSATTARAVAAKQNIQDVEADVLPRTDPKYWPGCAAQSNSDLE